MSKRKNRTRLVGQMRLGASRKPYYYQVYLWETIEDLKAYFEVDDDTLAMTSFEPWFVDQSTGQVYINPKLGEIHFAREHWNVNVVAHEVQHAIIHRMRLIWPPAHLIMMDEYADAEEEIAYETGNWVERIHTWLWGLDPGLHNPKPYQRADFGLPQHLSEVNFQKSSVKRRATIKPSEVQHES